MGKEVTTTLKGKVRRYKGNGRKFGYPTANISTLTTLADGVYFGFADLGIYTQQPALIFIGMPLTLGDTERRVEAHLLDAIDTDYYGQEIVLYVRYFHRRNQKLGTIDALLAIMKTDEVTARLWFTKKRIA